MISEDKNIEKEPKAQKKMKAEKGDKKAAEQKARIEELENKLGKEHDDYIRLMAEFETFRRRNAEDRLNLISTASADLIKEILPVLDTCGQALKMVKEDSAEREGLQLIADKLMGVLKSRGLAEIKAMGEKFDPDMHEAIAQIPAPSEELKGVIIDVTRTGYTLSGKVIRYPQVVVGA